MAGNQISFSVYPVGTNRVPGVYAEVSPVNANAGQVNQKTLLIGQMLSSGTAAAGVPIIDPGLETANTVLGYNSMLALMLAQYRKTDPFGEVWLLPVADNGSGVAGVFTATITGTATAAGTLNCYVAGVNVQVGVNNGDTATTVATNLAAAINTAQGVPATATSSAGVVTLTAMHKGAAAGDLDLRLNYRGALGGEFTPAGVTVAFATTTAGATDPDLATALSNLGSEMLFDFICTPYTGSTQLSEITSTLSDTTGRWSYLYELFGGAFTAYRGTSSALTTWGVTNNNQHVSALGFYDSPTPAYLVAADYTAAAASSLRVNPAVPLHGAQMNWLPPPVQSRFLVSQRNTMLFDGVSTFKVGDDGTVGIERAVTTYQKNGSGDTDTSYLDVCTLYTLQYLIRDLRSDLMSKFARTILVNDGTRIGYGSNFSTPTSILNEAIANYRKNAALGLCQNPDIFAQQATAQAQGNGVVALQLPIQVAGQLQVIAALVDFSKPN